MRLQSSQANCGAAALYNAMCALGLHPSLEECEKACETKAEGTTEPGMLKGIKKLGLKVVKEIKERREDVARLVLSDGLLQGQVAVLAFDGDTHWVSALGTSGTRLLVADSDEHELVIALSPAEFLLRWKSPNIRKQYYGVLFSS